MAQVLALGASVIAVIQMCDSIINITKQYIEAVKDAPRDLHVIRIEVSTLKAVFESLQVLRDLDCTPPNLAWPFKAAKAKKFLDDIMRYKTTISLCLSTETAYVLQYIFSCLLSCFLSLRTNKSPLKRQQLYSMETDLFTIDTTSNHYANTKPPQSSRVSSTGSLQSSTHLSRAIS